jgi:Bacterial TSP3 repeat
MNDTHHLPRGGLALSAGLRPFCLGISVLVLAQAATVQAQSVTAAEYFIDADPGPGLGTTIPIATPGATVALSVTVPPATLAALPTGIHRLTCRVRDGEGDWSQAFMQPLYKEAPLIGGGAVQIIAAEYFIDTDPGPGLGTAIPVPTPVAAQTFTSAVPQPVLTALTPGIHRLATRVKDADGDWSQACLQPLYKDVPQATTAPLLARIDVQWFQNGASVTPVTALTPPTAANPISFQRLASLAGLLEGQSYQLVFTPYETLGTQGVSETRTVLVQTTDSDGDGVADQWEITHGFSPNSAADMDPTQDADGDGISNREEFTRQLTPRAADTDGDGMNDKAELDLASLGFDPKVAQGTKVTALRENANNAGLYSRNQFQALSVGGLLLERPTPTGPFKLNLSLKKSTDLTTYVPLPFTASSTAILPSGKIEATLNPTDNALFYRVTAE